MFSVTEPKNPGFLSPVVIANSEPSAPLAGSPTTTFFSFYYSLGLDVTEDIPVRVQANSSSPAVCVQKNGPRSPEVPTAQGFSQG